MRRGAGGMKRDPGGPRRLRLRGLRVRETVKRHEGMVTAVALDAGGGLGVSIGSDGRCIIWDAKAGVPKHDLVMSPCGHAGSFAAFLEVPSLAVVEMPSRRLRLIEPLGGAVRAAELREVYPRSRWNNPADFGPSCIAASSGALLLKACPVLTEHGPHRWMELRFPPAKDLQRAFLDEGPVSCGGHQMEGMAPYGSGPFSKLWEASRGRIPQDRICRRFDLTAMSGRGRVKLFVDAPSKRVHVTDDLRDIDWPVAVSLWSHALEDLEWDDRSRPGALHDCGLDRLCAVSSDATRALIGDSKGNLVFIALQDTDLMKVASAHRDAIAACCLSGDGKLAATVGMDFALRLWDCRTQGMAGAADLPASPKSCAICRSGSRIMVGLSSGAVLFYSVEGAPARRGRSRTGLEATEESVANRLRLHTEEGISRITSVSLLDLVYRSPAAAGGPLHRAAIDRLMELGARPVARLSREDRGKADAVAHELALNAPDPETRLLAVNAIEDPHLLRELQERGGEDVAQAAVEKSAMLAVSHRYGVVEDAAVRDKPWHLGRLLDSIKGEIFVRTGGAFIRGADQADLYSLDLEPGAVLEVYAEPEVRERCAAVLAGAPFLKALPGPKVEP